MSDIANTDDVNIGDNEGKVGAENEVAVEGKYERDCTFLLGCIESFIKSFSHHYSYRWPWEKCCSEQHRSH